MNALLRAEPEVLARRVDHGEVDRDLGRRVDECVRTSGDLQAGAAQPELIEIDARVVRIDRGNELELGVGVHRLADGRAHATAGTEDPDADHIRHTRRRH